MNRSTKKYDNLYFGMSIGLAMPFVIMLIYYQLNFASITVVSFIFDMVLKNILIPLLSLCTLVNLGIFYLFYWFQKDKSSRGVVLATLIYAFIVFGFKLFN